MSQHIVFKFLLGFGNRLCNLMNLFYIHDKYPNALIYINWIKNKHCDICINDVFDMSKYKYIMPYETYCRTRNKASELWATTSVNDRTRWDNIDEWGKHSCIVSVSFNLYSFVTPEYCIKMFNSLVFKEPINTMVSHKITKHGFHQKYIHFRNGDLTKVLYECESPEKVTQLREKVSIFRNCVFEYNQICVDRDTTHMLHSISDLIFLSKHSIIIGYCPYSHFSSWVFILSSSFINNVEKYPVFNYKVIDVVLLTDIADAGW